MSNIKSVTTFEQKQSLEAEAYTNPCQTSKIEFLQT